MKVFEEKGCGSDSWTRVIITIVLLHYYNVSYKCLKDEAKIMNEQNPANYTCYVMVLRPRLVTRMCIKPPVITTENHAKQYEAEPIKAQGQTGPIKF